MTHLGLLLYIKCSGKVSLLSYCSSFYHGLINKAIQIGDESLIDGDQMYYGNHLLDLLSIQLNHFIEMLF